MVNFLLYSFKFIEGLFLFCLGIMLYSSLGIRIEGACCLIDITEEIVVVDLLSKCSSI